jgi:hypothetical protein
MRRLDGREVLLGPRGLERHGNLLEPLESTMEQPAGLSFTPAMSLQKALRSVGERNEQRIPGTAPAGD